MGVLMVALTLFLPAGTVKWPMGWALVGLYAGWVLSLALLVLPKNPELLAERAVRKLSPNAWDNAILGTLGLATISKNLVVGLDFRYAWTASSPLWVQLAALIIAVMGYALLTWSMVANAYFALVVRI
jgi:hypothetical protein